MRSATRSLKPGKSTSKPEITHISPWGIWLLFGDTEFFLSFKQFPWFQNATIAQIQHLEQQGPEHLYWPELDVDLDLDRIREPEKFPLLART
jgi:hypothetical protein